MTKNKVTPPLKYIISWILILLYAVSGIAGEIKISGNTMGTTYHIVIAEDSAASAPDNLKEKIDEALKYLNKSMSTFIPDSEISRFNRFEKTGVPFPVSDNFFKVITMARKIYDYSDGAWDGTVKPVIDLWGFGNGILTDEPPDEKLISAALEKCGFNQIHISDKGDLTKKSASVTLDLASIAKGYAVDYCSDILKKENITCFLVEIGGEVYCAGQKSDQSKWRVGINTPTENALPQAVYDILYLKDKALATSGDYRNFFKKEGKRYSHIIDPQTGHPVDNGVVSVSITSRSCAFSDGLATAVMVMGHEKGLALVNRLEDTECLIIVKNKDHTFSNYFSPGFKPLETR